MLAKVPGRFAVGTIPGSEPWSLAPGVEFESKYAALVKPAGSASAVIGCWSAVASCIGSTALTVPAVVWMSISGVWAVAAIAVGEDARSRAPISARTKANSRSIPSLHPLLGRYARAKTGTVPVRWSPAWGRIQDSMDRMPEHQPDSGSRVHCELAYPQCAHRVFEMLDTGHGEIFCRRHDIILVERTIGGDGDQAKDEHILDRHDIELSGGIGRPVREGVGHQPTVQRFEQRLIIVVVDLSNADELDTTRGGCIERLFDTFFDLIECVSSYRVVGQFHRVEDHVG